MMRCAGLPWRMRDVASENGIWSKREEDLSQAMNGEVNDVDVDDEQDDVQNQVD